MVFTMFVCCWLSLFKNKNYPPPLLKWIIIKCIPFAYYVLADNIPCLPLCLNIAVLAIPFLAIGHQFYTRIETYISQGYSMPKVCAVFMILLVVFIAGYKYFCPSINMLNNEVSPFYLFYGFAIIGSLLVLYIANLLTRTERLCGVFCWIGRNSLVIMCVHEPLKRIVLFILSKTLFLPIETMRENLLFSVMATIVVVLFCAPFVIFINRYCPIILGRCGKTNL